MNWNDSLTDPLLSDDSDEEKFYKGSVVKLVSPVTVLSWGLTRDGCTYLRFSHNYAIGTIELGDTELVQSARMKWRWRHWGREASGVQSPLSFESDWDVNGKIDFKKVCAKYPQLQSIGNTDAGRSILFLDDRLRNEFVDHTGLEFTDLVFSRVLTEEETIRITKTLRATYYNILMRWTEKNREYSCYRYN